MGKVEREDISRGDCVSAKTGNRIPQDSRLGAVVALESVVAVYLISFRQVMTYVDRPGIDRRARWGSAGGLTGKLYSWGDDFRLGDKPMANTYQGKFPVKDTGADGFAGMAPVASFAPNAYGLFDVAGNAWEWVSDWYRPDYYRELAKTGLARNPKGPASPLDPAEPGSAKRVQRGGSFLCTDQYCSRYMVGTRGKGEVSTASNHLGVRLVRNAK
jgi:formylglycine-generating enzyme required for sulfatase activity